MFNSSKFIVTWLFLKLKCQWKTVFRRAKCAHGLFDHHGSVDTGCSCEIGSFLSPDLRLVSVYIYSNDCGIRMGSNMESLIVGKKLTP